MYLLNAHLLGGHSDDLLDEVSETGEVHGEDSGQGEDGRVHVKLLACLSHQFLPVTLS